MAEARAEWDEFERPKAWQQSKRGNCWRKWGDLTLCVFWQKGDYRWVITYPDGHSDFSRSSYRRSYQAREALRIALNIGVL
jgi:hypothetical protein